MIKICKAELFTETILFITLTVVVAFFVAELQAQDKGVTLKASKNEPKVTIKVDKKSDANGNIIHYDSTYVSSWSGDGNMMPDNMDSLMRSMHERFFKDFQFGNTDSLVIPHGFNFQMNDSLGAFTDSTFLHHNFRNMFGDNFVDIEKLMQEQEKMMQQLFRQHRSLRMPNNTMPPSAPSQPQMPQKNDNNLKKEKMIKHSGYQVNT